MSRAIDAPGDWTDLGRTVWFDGPYGDRLCGEIVRVYFNLQNYHVLVEGQRYEVQINDDHMSPTQDPL